MIPAAYEKTFDVMDSHCDFHRDTKISEILNQFQDVATVHAGLLNCSFDAMRARGYFWVLSRVSMDILHAPRAGEKVLVRTFPEKPLPLQCYRCYTMASETGERLVNGYSMWCALDLKRNRLTPIRNISLLDPENFETRDFDAALDKILEEPGEEVYTKIVRATDLDANIHMNNTRYADVILDAFPLEYLNTHRVSHLQINYLSQARAGDSIRVRKKAGAEDEFFVSGSIGDTICFSSHIIFGVYDK